MLSGKCCLLPLLLAAVCCRADVTGKITGTVADPSGAGVGAATVTATQVGTGERKTAQTNAQGLYSLLALAPGRYNLEAQSPGFQTYEQRDIKVDVNASLEINVLMTLGSLNTKVEVAADALRVETINTQVGDVIGGKTM